MQVFKHAKTAQINICPESNLHSFPCRSSQFFKKFFLPRAQKAAVINNKFFRLFFRQKIFIIVRFIFDKGNAADIDLGGFCMFENLQTVFPQLEPMRMEGRFVEQYHKNGLKRPEQYLKKLKEERNAGRHTLFVDAIDKILQYGVTIEQETFLE